MSGALEVAESVWRCMFGLDPCLGGVAGYSYCSYGEGSSGWACEFCDSTAAVGATLRYLREGDGDSSGGVGCVVVIRGTTDDAELLC